MKRGFVLLYFEGEIQLLPFESCFIQMDEDILLSARGCENQKVSGELEYSLPAVRAEMPSAVQ